jgi:hypothetical protein
MSNYFITTEVIDNKFVAVVYNNANNTKLYQTQKHPVQADAINEANMYLRTNSLAAQPVPAYNATPAKCCGR